MFRFLLASLRPLFPTAGRAPQPRAAASKATSTDLAVCKATPADLQAPPAARVSLGAYNVVCRDVDGLHAMSTTAIHLESLVEDVEKLKALTRNLTDVMHDVEYLKRVLAPTPHIIRPDLARVATAVAAHKPKLMGWKVSQFEIACTVQSIIDDVEKNGPEDWLAAAAGGPHKVGHMLRLLYKACIPESRERRTRPAHPRDVLKLVQQHFLAVPLATDPASELKLHRLLVACAARPEVECDAAMLAEHEKYIEYKVGRWIEQGVIKKEDM